MKLLKLLLYTAIYCAISPLQAQWKITPSTPITTNPAIIESQWKTDSDINQDYIAVTYCDPNSKKTYLAVFESDGTPFNTPPNPPVADVEIFEYSTTASRVKLSSDNRIYVLGVQEYGTTNVLEIKRFDINGNNDRHDILAIDIKDSPIDLDITENNQILVSYFENDVLKIGAYDHNFIPDGNIEVAHQVTNVGSSPTRSQFMDYNNGKIAIGYSQDGGSGQTGSIVVYDFNPIFPAASTFTTYPCPGGFSREYLESRNSHQVALRANGDLFYVSATVGVQRLSGGNPVTVYPLTNTKINVDKFDRLLVSWATKFKAKALLFDSSNVSIRSYEEDGNITGSWAPAIYNCRFILAGDDSEEGSDYSTDRFPTYQLFNCSNCTIGTPPTVDFNFRYGNRVQQMTSPQGPQDVTELCLIDNLWVDGTPSCNEDSYKVEIVEIDPQNWTPIQPPLHSSWICTNCTAPNNIDIASLLPAGYQLRPNKVYRFQLSVGNQGAPISTEKFFTIACCRRSLNTVPYDPVKLKPHN